jgi:Pyruvate/2-oxoacid:ferredoxin oxidoreductase delta subunit
MSLLTNWLESLSYDIEISSVCLRSISPLSTCSVCKEACPTAAFKLEKGKIKINEKSCTSCGVCITVCPVQALKGQSPARKVAQKYLFIQEEAPLPTVGELLYFHQKGIRFIHHAVWNDLLNQRLNSTNEYLNAMGLEDIRRAEKIVLDQVQESKLSRRDFFTKLAADSKKSVLSSVTPAKWRFNEENFRLSSLYQDWSFYKVQISDTDCTFCEACFNICPSGTFDLMEETLIINEQKCSGCNLCANICRTNAIVIEKKIHQNPPASIPIHQSVCSHCGDSFHSWNGTNLCTVCSSKSQLNFLL